MHISHISEREEDLPDAVIGKLVKIAVEDKSVISFGAGEPHYPLPKPLIRSIPELAKNSNHYSPPAGLKELREAIAKKLKKDNKINTTPDNIIVTCGSQEAILLAAACTLDVSERVIIPDPSYLGYTPTFELFDAAPITVPVRENNNFGFDPDELKKSIIPKKTKAIMINTPGNPTGAVISRKMLEEISDIAVDKDLFIFSDEAYEKIVYDKNHISIASLNGMGNHVATFQSFSKSYAMCGFRVGYCAAPKKLVEAMTKTHTYTTLTAPTLSQKLAVKALSLPNKYVDDMVDGYRKNRDLMVKRLNDMGLQTRKPEGAFYAFSSIRNFPRFSKNSFKFANEILKKAKVAVVPGAEFGNNGEGYLRFSYATDYAKITQGMDRLELFLKKC